MLRLIEPNSSQERTEILNLLVANGIRYHETDASFLSPPALWVEETDYQKALEIAESVEARYSRLEKERWKLEWREKYGGSKLQWFLQKAREPGTWVRMALLAIMLGIFLVYPLFYVFRR